MAEHFYGRDHTVHFSNGAAEELLRAWIRLLERDFLGEAEAAVLAFLQSHLKRGFGWRAFELNPPPSEIATPERLRVVAETIQRFAEALCKEKPDSTLTDIDWDRDLRINWLARLVDLHRLVSLAIENPNDRPKGLVLSLAADDRNECELARLSYRQIERERRAKQSGNSVPFDETIDRIDELLEVAHQCRPSKNIKRTIANLFYDRGMARWEGGCTDEAIVDLRKSAECDPSADTRQITLDTIAELADQEPG